VVLVFLAGALFELSYLLWLYVSSRRQPLRSCLLSMLTGAISVYGITSVVTTPAHLPALLLGYGAGSYIAVKYFTSAT
jgi:hypothetical protein